MISRGHLYWILSNPIYVGRLRHKGQTYHGLHPGGVDAEIWERVQQKLASQTQSAAIAAYLISRLIANLPRVHVMGKSLYEDALLRITSPPNASAVRRGGARRDLPGSLVHGSTRLAPEAIGFSAGPQRVRCTSTILHKTGMT